MVHVLREISWHFLKKLNIELPYDYVIPLQDICQIENRYSNKYLNISVHSSTIHNSPKMETNQISTTDEWRDKL